MGPKYSSCVVQVWLLCRLSASEVQINSYVIQEQLKCIAAASFKYSSHVAQVLVRHGPIAVSFKCK